MRRPASSTCRKARKKYDEFFGESEVYYNEVIGRLSIARATPEAMDLELEIGYQGCADGRTSCYLPQTRIMTVSLPEATDDHRISPTLPPADAPISEQGRIAQIINGSSLLAVVGTMFGLGTVCWHSRPACLPMIPILTAIIAGEGDEVTPARGFTLAFSYVLGMAIVYTAAGVSRCCCRCAGTGGLPTSRGYSPCSPALFVLLAIAMFGAFDLQMPSCHPEASLRQPAATRRAVPLSVLSLWVRCRR